MTRISLREAVQRLEAEYGKPPPPAVTDAWQMILWENVAYLADDERRLAAFRELKKHVGLRPKEILAAPDEALIRVTSHGILAKQFAEKLRRCARVVLDEFDGKLQPTLRLPLAKARRALQKFPGIGEPGAEKVLLFTRSYPILALESNGLRVLVRLGFGEEHKNYSTRYRSVQRAIADELTDDYDWLIAAHLLLRQHGKELCRSSDPQCRQCPLVRQCRYRQTLAREP